MGDGKRRRDVDSGWAWVALMASLSINCITTCLDTAYGIFQDEVNESYPGSQSFVALIFSIAFGGPVSGVISDLLTTRVNVMIGGALMSVGLLSASFVYDLVGMLFFLGVVCGIGHGLTYTASNTVISSTYFVKYRTVAVGISMAAPGIGVISAPYLLRWLIDDYGWRLAMGTFACFLAQTCILGSLFYPHTPSATLTRCWSLSHNPTHGCDQEMETPQNRVYRTSHFDEETELIVRPETTRDRIKALLCKKFLWVVCLNQMMMTAGFTTSFNFFPAYAESVGVSFEDLPYLYTAYGIGLLLARVAGGILFTLFPNLLLKGLFFVELVFSLAEGFLPLYGISFQSLFAERIVSCLAYGPSMFLVGPLLVQHMGPKNLPMAFGIVMLCCGVGSIAGPPIAGALYNIYGTINVCYYFAGTASAWSAASVLLIPFHKDN
ncbi:monocarboxylate transporter 12-like isoform X2 [Babylonia areolata]|uniref:monocarboxylate transporter 12-like isoform X2 n=1 Tax=Babylonia areolata TaxID=304850 RepID=UPI003FD5021A